MKETSSRPLEASVTRADVLGQPLYTLLVRDLTAARKAELELRAREEMFRLLSICSPVGIFLADVQGNLTYGNPRFLAVCGCAIERVGKLNGVGT